jgi:hypothetical protein
LTRDFLRSPEGCRECVAEDVELDPEDGDRLWVGVLAAEVVVLDAGEVTTDDVCPPETARTWPRTGPPGFTCNAGAVMGALEANEIESLGRARRDI